MTVKVKKKPLAETIRAEVEPVSKEGQKMGAVIVKVKLTNYGDQVLFRRGMLPREQIRSVEADALVDIGAVQSVIPPAIANQLGLSRIGTQMAQYANGLEEEVDVTEAIEIEIMGRRVSEETLVLGDEVLIGQTVLEKTDLHADCREQRLIPNPAHPNQPVIKIR
ncbi:MAG: retroviral-like aspartic protease family protein [Blastocatellia bacterium]